MTYEPIYEYEGLRVTNKESTSLINIRRLNVSPITHS